MKKIRTFFFVGAVVCLFGCVDTAPNSQDPKVEPFWYTKLVLLQGVPTGMQFDTTIYVEGYPCHLIHNSIDYYDLYNNTGKKIVSGKKIAYIQGVSAEKYAVVPNVLVDCTIYDSTTDNGVYVSRVAVSLDGVFSGEDMYQAIFDYNESDSTYCFIQKGGLVGRVRYDGVITMKTAVPGVTRVYAKSRDGLYAYYAIPKPGEYHTYGTLNASGEIVTENKIELQE